MFCENIRQSSKTHQPRRDRRSPLPCGVTTACCFEQRVLAKPAGELVRLRHERWDVSASRCISVSRYLDRPDHPAGGIFLSRQLSSSQAWSELHGSGVRRYAASLAPSAAITQMTTLSYERLGSVFFAVGSILLAVYASLFVLLLPIHDGDFDYVRLVTSPHWRSIALIAFVGVVSLLTGLEAVYSRIRDSAGILGATGLVLTKVALVLQACVLTWEMLMDPLIAAHPESAFLLRDGGIINAPWMVAFRWVFLLTILGGALLFGLAVLRSKQFPMPAIGLLIAGAVLYAVGPRVSVFVAISGVILFAIGGLLIGVRLWRATAA